MGDHHSKWTVLRGSIALCDALLPRAVVPASKLEVRAMALDTCVANTALPSTCMVNGTYFATCFGVRLARPKCLC